MAILYTIDGTPEEVPDEEVRTRILSGRYGFRRGIPVQMLDTAGRPVAIDPDDVPSAFAAGFNYRTAAQRAQAEAEERFGGVGGGLAAAALGVGSGLTLGLSDVAAEAAGAPVQEIKAAQPGISLGAGVAGAVLPALATGGESLIAKGLAATPAAGAARVGTGVTAAAKAALGEAPAGAGLLAKAVRAAAPPALGGATEGAIWGGTQQAVEDFIADKELAAERILPAAGIGALFGGTASGLFGAAGMLAKEASAIRPGVPRAPASAPTLESVVARLQGADEDLNFAGNLLKKLGQDDKAEAVSILTRLDGEGAADRALAFTPARSRAKKWADYAKGFLGFVDEADKAANSISGKGEAGWGLIKREAIEAGLKSAPEGAPAGGSAAALRLMKETLADIKSTPAKYGRGEGIGGLEDIIVQFEKDVGLRKSTPGGHVFSAKNVQQRKPIELFQAVERAQSFLKRYAKFDHHTTSSQKPMVERMQTLYNDLAGILVDEGTWGKAGAEQSRLNSLTHEYLVSRDALQKAMGREAGQVERFFSGLRKPGGEGDASLLVDFLTAASKLSEAGVSPEVQAALQSVIQGTEEALKMGRAVGALKTLASHADAGAEAIGQTLFRRSGSFSTELGALAGYAVGGIPGAAVGAVARPLPAITALHLFERAMAASESARRVAIRAITRSLPKGVQPQKAVIPGAMKILSEIRFSDRTWPTKPRDIKEAYLQRRAELADTLSDPKRTDQILAEKGRAISDLGFPEVSAASQQLSRRIYLHLQRTMPKGPPVKIGKERLPSLSDISKWTSRVEGARDGVMALLRNFSNGTISPAQVETVRELYPREFEQMKADIITAVRTEGTKFSYQERVRLSVLLSEPLDSTMEPGFIAAMQANYAPRQPEGPPGSGPARQPNGSLRIPEMASSESDKMLT